MPDRIVIRGGRPLSGRLSISGAKNAALPLLCASLLTEEPVRVQRVPKLADVDTLLTLIAQHGARVTPQPEQQTVEIQAVNLDNLVAPYELVAAMRASILVLGPLLARMGEAQVSLPGGCAIGSRPVDFHLDAMRAFGADIRLDGGYIYARAPKSGLRGATVRFDIVSVGATENALMAAVLACGTSVLENAAREPEITNLAEMLVQMGAVIDGIGTSTLRIEGQERLSGTQVCVLEDRLEAGSYALAVAATGGQAVLEDLDPANIAKLLDKMRAAGVRLRQNEQSIEIDARGLKPQAVDITTQPFPGFPTDLQAQFMAFMAVADGVSLIRETIFENRFMHAEELRRLGAAIQTDGQIARVRGVTKLIGAPVEATDIRASAALLIAGLMAEGETSIGALHHLDRGYDDPVGKLTALGADIRRQKMGDLA